MKFSQTAQSALALSKNYAEEFKCRYAGTEHLLLGLVESEDEFLDSLIEHHCEEWIGVRETIDPDTEKLLKKF